MQLVLTVSWFHVVDNAPYVVGWALSGNLESMFTRRSPADEAELPNASLEL